MSDRMQFIPIDEPYDDFERDLLSRIEELKREYEEAIKPYVTALARSRSCKPTRGYMLSELTDHEAAALACKKDAP